MTCCAHFAKSPDDELAQLFKSNAATFAAVIDALVRAEVRHQVEDADEPDTTRLERLLAQTTTLADFLGRRRLVLEFRAARKRVSADLQAQAAFQRADIPGVPNVPFGEAVADLLRRTPEIRRSAAEVADLYATRHAFAMARSAEIAITRKVRGMLARAQQVGLTEPTAGQVIAAVDPTRFSQAYARTVYRTNLSTAYSAGRHQQAADPEIAAVMSAFEYIGPTDVDTRQGRKQDGGENHLAAVGLIAATQDTIWTTHSPPSGYNCRHTLRLVSKFELKRMGLLDDSGRVRRREPSGLSSFRAHENFGRGRPDHAIYLGTPQFNVGAVEARASWPASFAAEMA